jgi:homoserine dehydrogenase
MDPADDINGKDTAHKLIVLLGLALGFFPTLGEMHVEGISSINPEDVQFAMDLGYRIKLLAIAQKLGGELEARVHPALVPENSWLARLQGVENGMELRDEIGLEIGMQAPGAGKYPTATAIIEDFMCIAQERKVVLPSRDSKLHLKDMGQVETKYYLKFLAADKAGVLASIANIFGGLGISIESVIQKGRQTREQDQVPIIMLTHRSREESIQQAVATIRKLPVIRQDPFLVRVEEGVF